MTDPRQQIKDSMYRLRITQTELARRLGVSRSAVSRSLRASSNPSITTLVKMARAMGLTMTFTLKGKADAEIKITEYSQADRKGRKAAKAAKEAWDDELYQAA